MPWIAAPIIGLVFVVGLAVAKVTKKADKPTRGEKIFRRRRLAAAKSTVDLEWREEEIQVAACAMWNSNIWDPTQMAQGIANSVYGGQAWPPGDNAHFKRRMLWLDLIAYSKKVIDDPSTYCG